MSKQCKGCNEAYETLRTIRQENEALKLQLAGRTYYHSDEQINADLKEAEGAVADLMTLNDTLTAEVEALSKCKETGYDPFEAGKAFADRKLKAEVELINKTVKLQHEVTMSVGKRAEKAEEEVVEWRKLVDECAGLFKCPDKTESPLMSNLPNLIRDLKSDKCDLLRDAGQAIIDKHFAYEGFWTVQVPADLLANLKEALNHK